MKTFFILISLLFLLSACSQVDTTNKSSDIPAQTISTTSSWVHQASGASDIHWVEGILKDAYSEERLAEAIYTKMFEKYPALSEVSHIIQSEEKHSEQVGRLLDARNISRPTDYGKFNETYTTLSQMIDSSLTGAIEVGVIVEVGDIDHLLEEYKKLEDSDIRMVFENIGGWSFNHLRAFLRFAESNSYTVTTDYARYMSTSDINSTWPLQRKMTELLEANNLPVSGTAGNRGNGQGGGRMMGRF